MNLSRGFDWDLVVDPNPPDQCALFHMCDRMVYDLPRRLQKERAKLVSHGRREGEFRQ